MANRRFGNWSEWIRRLTPALSFLVVTWLMLAPASTFREVGEFLPHQDKIGHGTLFLALGFLARWALPARGGRGRKPGMLAALLLYAGAIEALQPVFGGAGRQFDWLDMACNVVGASAGWLLFGVARASRLKQAGSPPVIERVCDRTAG